MKRMCKKWANVIFALSLFVVMSAGNLQAQSSNVVSDWTLSDGVKVGGARAYAGLHYPNSAREGEILANKVADQILERHFQSLERSERTDFGQHTPGCEE